MTKQEQNEVDLFSLTKIPVFDHIAPDVLQRALSQPPFIAVPGALNIRVISRAPSPNTGLIFRSGDLGSITDEGKRILVEKFGIKTIFDLRSRKEREDRPSPDIPGANTTWIPSVSDTDELRKKTTGSLKPENFIEDGGEKAYAELYMNILAEHKNAYRHILLRLAGDEPGGILFHCTGTYFRVLNSNI